MSHWAVAYLNLHEPARPREHRCRHLHRTRLGACRCMQRIAKAARAAWPVYVTEEPARRAA
jgi:hypothetical protein